MCCACKLLVSVWTGVGGQQYIEVGIAKIDLIAMNSINARVGVRANKTVIQYQLLKIWG